MYEQDAVGGQLTLPKRRDCILTCTLNFPRTRCAQLIVDCRSLMRDSAFRHVQGASSHMLLIYVNLHQGVVYRALVGPFDRQVMSTSQQWAMSLPHVWPPAFATYTPACRALHPIQLM